MMTIKRDHEQITFRTAKGEIVNVDDDIYWLITLLNDMGVHTQYSCQGGNQPAYVIADRKSFAPVLRTIKRYRRDEVYSEESMELAAKFFDGGYDRFFSLFIERKGIDKLVVAFRRIKKINLEHRIEKIYSNRFGWVRIVFRWPPEDTNAFIILLNETYVRRHHA